MTSAPLSTPGNSPGVFAYREETSLHDPEDTGPDLPTPVWRIDPADRIAYDREAAFASYVERSEPYFAAIAANGGTPWFSSLDERRDLFMRRYSRPAPLAGLACDPDEIHPPEYRTDTTIPAAECHVQSRAAAPLTDTTTKENIAA